MFYSISPVSLAVGLAIAMLASLELGRLLGNRRAARTADAGTPGFSAVDGVMFGLLGLVLAFTFASAASRFEQRRDLIRQEANAIGTAYLRLDLLPPERQPALRADFRAYLAARLAEYRHDAPQTEIDGATRRATALQARIWKGSVAAARETTGPQATTLLLPALNEMIDIVTTRHAATLNHPPSVIYAMVTLLACITAIHAGFAMAGTARRSGLHMFGFVLAIVMTVYVILDVEQPRKGLFRVEDADIILSNVATDLK